MRSRTNGQHLIEYALLFAVVVGALVAIQVYVKRTLQARYRAVVDAAAVAISAPTQYEPYYRSETSAAMEDTQQTLTSAPGGQLTTATRSRVVGDAGAVSRVGVDLAADDEWGD